MKQCGPHADMPGPLGTVELLREIRSNGTQRGRRTKFRQQRGDTVGVKQHVVVDKHHPRGCPELSGGIARAGNRLPAILVRGPGSPHLQVQSHLHHPLMLNCLEHCIGRKLAGAMEDNHVHITGSCLDHVGDLFMRHGERPLQVQDGR